MGAHDGLLGPALASWNDFIGTAAADESTTSSLYEFTGLDPAEWLILSVDLDTTAAAESLVVYALDRAGHGVSSDAEAIDLGYQNGELPVTAFELSLADHQLSASTFERLAVRLVARGFQDQQLTVQARRRLPEQSERSRSRSTPL